MQIIRGPTWEHELAHTRSITQDLSAFKYLYHDVGRICKWSVWGVKRCMRGLPTGRYTPAVAVCVFAQGWRVHLEPFESTKDCPNLDKMTKQKKNCPNRQKWQKKRYGSVYLSVYDTNQVIGIHQTQVRWRFLSWCTFFLWNMFVRPSINKHLRCSTIRYPCLFSRALRGSWPQPAGRVKTFSDYHGTGPVSVTRLTRPDPRGLTRPLNSFFFVLTFSSRNRLPKAWMVWVVNF